jgi:RNA polymerase sigma-70 factor (ECF subfamily)
VDQRAVGRRYGRPGRPNHPGRVGQHGLPRRARVDDPGRARRVHPPRCLPLPLRGRAEIVGRTPAACRQLASSARRRIRASQAPATPTARRAGIVRAFKEAWEARDIDALIGLLDPDATAIADGGGLVSAELRPIEGGEQIARLLVDVAGKAPDLTILERTVNGQPGLVGQQDGVTVTVMAFDVAGDRIKHIWSVRNPEKLRPWTTA